MVAQFIEAAIVIVTRTLSLLLAEPHHITIWHCSLTLFDHQARLSKYFTLCWSWSCFFLFQIPIIYQCRANQKYFFLFQIQKDQNELFKEYIFVDYHHNNINCNCIWSRNLSIYCWLFLCLMNGCHAACFKCNYYSNLSLNHITQIIILFF